MIAMPLPDEAVLARRAEIVQALRRIVPGEGVIYSERERRSLSPATTIGPTANP